MASPSRPNRDRKVERRIIAALAFRPVPLAFGDLRDAARLTRVARDRVWAALRRLVDRGEIAMAYQVELDLGCPGFPGSGIRYPVFSAAPSTPPPPARGDWWGAMLAAARPEVGA